jgi:hypothetical protein
MEETNCDLLTRQPFAYLYTEMDDSAGARETALLLIFLRSVNDKFDVPTELFSTDAMKGTIVEDFMKGSQQFLSGISYRETN